MWRTSIGERVLQGAEWELFCAGVSVVWDLVEESDDDCDLSECGIGAFDTLQPNQKLALLALVGKALQDEALPSPKLTAHTEATVAAIFEHIRQSIEMEIEVGQGSEPTEEPLSWRRLVLAAYREVESVERERLPSPSDEDQGEWVLLLECLEDRILWDSDYELGDVFLDADPAGTRGEMRSMGIAEDYYVEVAPDPTEEELEPIRCTLRSITGRPEPEEPALVPGMEDTYHGLLVGPCDPETLCRETSCPLIAEIHVSEADDFDCSYAEWAELFRQEVYRAASEPVEAIDPQSVLSSEQLAEAERARATGAALVLSDGHRIELRESGWVIADANGNVLIEVENSAWADEDDPDLPPLRFDGPEAALVAYVRSESAAASRAKRYRGALRRLGIEESC